MTPPFKSDRLRADLKLETGIAEAPTASLMVFASVRPRVVPEPRHIRLPAKLEADWKQAVRLVWDDDKPHKVLEATVDDPKLEVRVDEKGGRQQVVLLVPQQYKPQLRRSNVIIKTDDAEAPEVRVPIIVSRAARHAGANRRRPARSATTNLRVGKQRGLSPTRAITGVTSDPKQAQTAKSVKAPAAGSEKAPAADLKQAPAAKPEQAPGGKAKQGQTEPK